MTTQDLIVAVALLSALALAISGPLMEHTRKAEETKEKYNAIVQQREEELELYFEWFSSFDIVSRDNKVVSILSLGTKNKIFQGGITLWKQKNY